VAIHSPLKSGGFLASMLKIIKREPCYLREISKKMDMFPSAVLKHLIFMENNGLITSEIAGKKKYYKLTNKGKEILDLL
jgi:predicted transcriptional regulator